jgi:hypothetical protein
MAVGVRPAEIYRARPMELDPRVGDEPPARARAPEVRPQAGVEAAPDDATPDDATPDGPAPTSSARDPELHDRVVGEVGRQLAGQRSALARTCAPGGGAGAAFSVGATFNAEGAMLGMAISDAEKSEAAGEIGACLRGQSISLSLEPPGQVVSVNVPLRLP